MNVILLTLSASMASPGIFLHKFSGGPEVIISRNLSSFKEFLTLQELGIILQNLSDFLPGESLHCSSSMKHDTIYALCMCYLFHCTAPVSNNRTLSEEFKTGELNLVLAPPGDPE